MGERKSSWTHAINNPGKPPQHQVSRILYAILYVDTPSSEDISHLSIWEHKTSNTSHTNEATGCHEKKRNTLASH